MKTNIYLSIKRVADIVLSAGFIIILSPVFLLVSVIIKITEDGSVIFKQKRLGKDSVPFEIYKFRSMSKTAPNVSAHKFDHQDYVTKTGKFLRKTSIDELPQLFNILKGEMSFVGPRPVIPEEGIINDLRKKHHVDQLRPGLTGLAQTKARDTIDQEMKFSFDLYYYEHVSFKLDIEILFRTLFALKGK